MADAALDTPDFEAPTPDAAARGALGTEDLGFDDPRLAAVAVVFQAHAALACKFHEIHARRGLSTMDFDTLLRLARAPDRQLRMTDLAAQTSLSTSGITRVVDRLEREGLVNRRTAPGDRRSLLAVLSPAGYDRLIAGLPDVMAAVDEYMVNRLTSADLATMLDGLRTVRDAVHPDGMARDDFDGCPKPTQWLSR